MPRCFLPAQQRHQSNALDARIEGRRSGAGSRRPRRCRCAASAAVPTAQPGKTKVAFLGIGIMGNAMVGAAAAPGPTWDLHQKLHPALVLQLGGLTPAAVSRLSHAGWLPVSRPKQAANLLKAGYEVTVWNRSPDKCAGLAAAGATVGLPVGRRPTAHGIC